MHTQRQFITFVLTLAGLVLTVFLLEFIGEWYLAGRPAFADLAVDAQKATKPADYLSPTARAYNNILAMILATVALAIPLTANMYTPKLIDMFLRDRINQFMLFFWAILAAHVIWVLYLASPAFTPVWMIRVAVFGAIFGWIALVPYFFYIVRFLDPTHILARIQNEADRALEQVEAGSIDAAAGQAIVYSRLHQIGTVILKTIDRGERGVTLEGIQCLQEILIQYGGRKGRMPVDWFKLDRLQFVGMSAEAIAILEADKTWLEHRVLSHVLLAYQGSLAKAPDIISALSDASRQIALLADQRGDEKALELSVKYFNNYLREAIKRRDTHAMYDLTFQYRVLADSLWQRPALLKKIGAYFQFYVAMAEAHGLTFVTQVAGVDLSWIVQQAYEHNSPAAPELLAHLITLKHGADRLILVKAKAILGGYFVEKNLTAEAGKLRANLADVPAAIRTAVGTELLTLEDRTFWEVTDRQVMFEWVPPEKRPAVKAFIDSIE